MTAASDAPSEAPPDAPLAERIVRKGSPTYAWVGVAVVVVVLAAGLGAAFELKWIGHASSGGGHGSCPTGQTLAGAGANFVLPLVSQWEASYHASSGNQVSYIASGSGTGITSLQAPTVDFAATDDPLNASQVAGFKGHALLTVPISAGALAIVYNLPEITSPISLSGAVLAEIYSGTIINWNDSAIRAINPGLNLPSQTIVTIHRSDPAGTTYVLSDFLSQESTAWKGGPGKGISLAWPSAPTQRAVQGNSALASFVLKTGYTIGYVDLTDVLNTVGLQYAKVENPSGKFVLPNLVDSGSAITTMVRNTTFPSPTNVPAWGNVSMVNSPAPADYPLTTLVYFFVYADLGNGYQPSSAKAQTIVQWLNWVVTTGQNDASPLYYVPLPSSLVALDQTGLASIAYNGATVPACS